MIRAFATFQLQHLIQSLEGDSAHFLAWDANGSQGWPGQESEGNVVDANHGNVPGNVNARLLKRAGLRKIRLHDTRYTTLSPELRGAASGVLNAVRQVGLVIGTAVIGALLQCERVLTFAFVTSMRL